MFSERTVVWWFLVFDDEDEHIITTGAVVTLTIHLQREDMSSVFNKEWTANTSTAINSPDEEVNEEQVDDKENREKVKERRCWLRILISIVVQGSRRIESGSECPERLDQQSGQEEEDQQRQRQEERARSTSET